MKLSFVIGAAAGYVLGAKAGRERYESIVRNARKVSGSQMVQTTAGVLKAQTDAVSEKLKTELGKRLNH